jgi:hypothetical protein
MSSGRRDASPPCSLGLSATSQQYFSLTRNQPPATSRNQPAVLFSQNKPAPAISHQPTEQGAARTQQSVSILMKKTRARLTRGHLMSIPSRASTSMVSNPTPDQGKGKVPCTLLLDYLLIPPSNSEGKNADVPWKLA